MIVCSCNVLSDADINEALASPAPPRTPFQVQRALGCKARCGRCTKSIVELIKEAREEPCMAREEQARVA